MIRILAATLFACLLTVFASAADIYFTVQQNTGTYVEVRATADPADVNYPYMSGAATAPGWSLWAFSNGIVAEAHAAVDSTYSVGWHYIGYFYGGGDCYLYISN